jgi:sulfite reductase alpha subunit
MKVEPPYDELYELISNIIEWWDDNAKPRERIGELIEVEGMRPFLEAIGVPPQPQQVFEPRKDPFFFWKEEDFDKYK